MTDSKLKLNANKTEFLIIDTRKQRGKLDCFFSDTYAKPEFHTNRLSTEFLLTPARQPRQLLILIYFLFPVLRLMSELELFQLMHRGSHSLLVLST